MTEDRRQMADFQSRIVDLGLRILLTSDPHRFPALQYPGFPATKFAYAISPKSAMSSTNVLTLSSEAVHGQSETGLHAADGLGQQSNFIFGFDIDLNIQLAKAHSFGSICQLHDGRNNRTC